MDPIQLHWPRNENPSGTIDPRVLSQSDPPVQSQPNPPRVRRVGRVIRSPTPPAGFPEWPETPSPIAAMGIDWTPAVVDDGISLDHFLDDLAARNLAEEQARADEFFFKVIDQDMVIDSSPVPEPSKPQTPAIDAMVIDSSPVPESSKSHTPAALVNTANESTYDADDELTSSSGPIDPDWWLEAAQLTLHRRLYFKVKAWGIRDLFNDGSEPLSLSAGFQHQVRVLYQQGRQYDALVRAMFKLIKDPLPDSRTLNWYIQQIGSGVETLERLREQFYPDLREMIRTAENIDRDLADDRGEEETMLPIVEPQYQSSLRNWAYAIDGMLEVIAREMTNIQSGAVASVETGVPSRDSVFSPTKSSAPAQSIDRKLSTSSVLTELDDAQIEALRPSPPRKRRQVRATGATAELRRLNIDDNVYSRTVPRITAASSGTRRTRSQFEVASRGVNRRR